MKRFLLYIIVATSLLPMGVAQNFVYYGDSCYCFNEPDTILLPSCRLSYDYNLEIQYSGGGEDRDYAIQRYAKSKSIYGIALMLEYKAFQYINHETGIVVGVSCTDEPDAQTAMEYLDVFALLYIKHDKGELEKVDSIRWHPDSAYRYFIFRQPEFSFYRVEPMYELYFDNPHFLAETDTAWVGVSVSFKDTFGIQESAGFQIYTARDFSYKNVWLEECRREDLYGYPHDMDSVDWGGVFPITCPKPEGPVEDTVDNGIARVRDLSEEVTVYPNPAREWVEVRSEGGEVLGVTVYDMRGQVVHREEANRRHGRVCIGALPNGVYMMRVETEKGTAIKKVVKR